MTFSARARGGRLCSYATETKNKFSKRWSSYRSTWNRSNCKIDENDKHEVALSRQYSVFHGNVNKPPIHEAYTSLLLNNLIFFLWISVKISGIINLKHKLIIKTWSPPAWDKFCFPSAERQARNQGGPFGAFPPPEIFKTLHSNFDICRNFQIIKLKFCILIIFKKSFT